MRPLWTGASMAAPIPRSGKVDAAMAFPTALGNRRFNSRRAGRLFRPASWVAAVCLVGTLLAAMTAPAIADPGSGPQPPVADGTAAPSQGDTPAAAAPRAGAEGQD